MLLIKDEKGHSQVWGKTSGNHFRSQYRIEKILTQLKPQSQVLELGTGHGDLTLALLQAGHKVTSLDRSPAMLAVTREKCQAHPSLELVQCEIKDFLGAHQNAGFDAVVGMGILHHFSQDLPRHIKLLAGVLSSEGRGFFWEPNRNNPLVQTIFGSSWGRSFFSLEEGEDAFAAQEMTKLLEKHFTSFKVSTEDWAYPFLPPVIQKTLRKFELIAPKFLRNHVAQSLWIEFYHSLSLTASRETPR